MSEDKTTAEAEVVGLEPVKKTRQPRAKKPEVVAEYEFLEELPTEQEAEPVTEPAVAAKDTRITKAIEGNETEPQKVEADKAFDLGTQQTPAIDGKPEPEPAPAKVDQPEIVGASKNTDTRVTAYIEEGETEPKPVKHEGTFAEDHHDQPNPGKVGGERVEKDPDVLAAPMESKAEKVEAKGDKPKTDNPKLKRLSKYREPKFMP